MVVEKIEDYQAILHELTELFANLKFRQQLIRRGLPLTTTWDEVKYNPVHREDFVNSVLKILRVAATLKYTLLYPECSKSMLILFRQTLRKDDCSQPNGG